MKKIIINSDNRRFNISSIVVGYLEENKEEVLEFEIPEKYSEYGKKACFSANGQTFAKTFDDIISNKLTITRDISQFKELDMTIAFFKIENEDEIIARTSILHILIENAIVCDDDVKPDDPKVIILDNLITKVTQLDNTITKNEEIREANEATRQQNETTREENEINRVNSEANREKAEESRKKAENKRVSNENARQSNEEERKTAENKRVSNENARQEYINNLKTQVDNGDFDGADFNYKWDGTKLGVKNSKETTYQYVELKGQKGDKGDKGEKGDTGNGIQNIEKVSTVGNVDTYAINYTDGTQTTFDVTNGEVTKEQLDEVDNKAKKTRNELERVKNDVLETGTDTDTFVHLEDSAMAEYQELSVDGVCEQETTNGITKSNTTTYSTTINDLTVSTDDDNIFTLNGTPASGINRQLREFIGKTYTLPAGDYYCHIDYISGSMSYVEGNTSGGIIINIRGGGNEQVIDSNNNAIMPSNYQNHQVKKFTLTNEEIIDRVQIMTGTVLTFNNLKIRIWWSTKEDDTYEPYTGGQPSPNPDYPQEIKTIENSLKITSCNKNLFDKNDENMFLKDITPDNNGLIVSVETSTSKPNYIRSTIIKCKPNTSYSISKLASKMFFIYESEEIPYLNYKTRLVTSNVALSKYSFTTSKSAKYIIFKFYNTWVNEYYTYNEILDSVQIEESPIATSYEQHLQSQIEANLPEGEFIGKINDTYKDTLKVEYNKGEGQYHLKLYKRVYKNNSYNGESYNYYISTTARKDGNIECGELQTGQVVYYDGDETKIDLGPIDMPLSYNEVTNIFTDSDLLPKINAKYYRNFVTTIQNLQVNEKALKQELADINTRLTALETAQTNVVESEEEANDIQVQ